MEASLAVVRRHREAGTILDEKGKTSPTVLRELGDAGYWGLLIDPRYGGSGAPFARFTHFLTRMATLDAMIAGMASIHGCIGAVDPVRTFGTPEQKERFLPKLANGQALSGFALTEPAAGSDLTALRTTAVPDGDDYVLNGEKLFITNVVPGRTAGVVVLIDGKPAVLVVDLPAEENEHFRVKSYGLYALRQAYNNGLIFKDFRVPKGNLLKPPVGDGLTIAYHGLNLGRLSLCAGAAGSMRVMLANMLPWAEFRRTYGQPIARRELVKRRIARLAGLIAGADALVGVGFVADRRGLPRRDGVHHRQDLRQRGHEGSGHRAVHEDARRPVVPQGPPVRRQRLRLPGAVHLRGRGRSSGHGVLQVAGQGTRPEVLRADRQSPAKARHEDAEPGQPGPGLEAAPGIASLRPLEIRSMVRPARPPERGGHGQTVGGPPRTSPWAGSPNCGPRRRPRWRSTS